MSEPGEDPRPAREEPDEEAGGIDRWLEPVFRDPAMGPVLLVAGASLATFGAALLLLAWRSRSPFAGAALAITFLLTVDIVRRDVAARRLGYVSRALLGWWALSIAAALAAVWSGIY